ncbi:MAG: hypothetical protein JSS44_01610 [Proteobacteria bacterium]|nr:hypothetical protein [Pseudomonadota bacterium]
MPGRFEQEPHAPFSFVDPNLDQAGGGDIPVLVALVVRHAQATHQGHVVVAQFGQLVHGLDVDRIGSGVDCKVKSGAVLPASRMATFNLLNRRTMSMPHAKRAVKRSAAFHCSTPDVMKA